MAHTSMQPKALVLRAPGTNCDQETAHAWRLARADPEVLHFHRLLENPARLFDFQVLTFPGGFSYGDDLGAGRVWSARIHLKLADTIREFVEKGGLVLGICNGFQVLVASGLLPAGARKDMTPTASLSYNFGGQFEARWVNMGVTPGNCVFLKGVDRIALPVAHGEGRFLTATPADLRALESAGQIVLRYVDPATGQPTETYPANPNGSPGAVAGVCDPTGRVFGLMPHPERFTSPLHHPSWTRFPKDAQPAADGLRIFSNAVAAIG